MAKVLGVGDDQAGDGEGAYAGYGHYLGAKGIVEESAAQPSDYADHSHRAKDGSGGGRGVPQVLHQWDRVQGRRSGHQEPYGKPE